MDFPIAVKYLLAGFGWTFAVASIGLVLAVVVGLIMGMIRHIRVPFLNQIIGAYVTVMRSTPFLVLLLLSYYVLPPTLGWYLNATQASILALLLHEGAYLTEIVKGSLDAVPKGQHEAAKALGFGLWMRFRHVIIPQARQIALPGVAGQAVLLVKATSILSLVGVTEVTRAGQQLTQIGLNAFYVYIAVAVLYAMVCLPLILLAESMRKSNGSKKQATVSSAVVPIV